MHAGGLSPTPPERTRQRLRRRRHEQCPLAGGPPMLLGAAGPPPADVGSGLRIGAVAGDGI